MSRKSYARGNCRWRRNRIEARVTRAETVAPLELSSAFATQATQLELMRRSAAEGERLAAAEILLSEQRFQEFAASLPAAIDATVTPRVEDLRERLRAEMDQSVTNTLQAFEQSS
jgi:hypothetical protein